MPPQNQKTSLDENVSSIGLFLLSLTWLVPVIFFHPWVIYSVWPSLPAPTTMARLVWLVLDTTLFIGILISLLRRRLAGRIRLAPFLFAQAPALGGILISIGLLLSFACLFELTFWGLHAARWRSDTKTTHYTLDRNLYKRDPLFGHRAPSPGEVRQKCYVNPGRKVVFDKTYTIAENGFRYTPEPEGEKEDFLAMFGCSFTFGLGVDDAETLPAYLAYFRPHTHVYNFAYPSWSPSQLLLILQQGVLDQIQEKDGTAVYVFIHDHLRRIVPDMKNDAWVRHFPAFLPGKNGTPIYAGSMEEVYPWGTWFYDVLQQERYVQWSGMLIPQNPARETFELCADMLAEARKLYCQKFPESDFYVLIEPITFMVPDIVKLMDALEARGVPMLCPQDAYGSDPEYFVYRRDKHPKPEGNYRLAEWLLSSLAGPALCPGLTTASSPTTVSSPVSR